MFVVVEGGKRGGRVRWNEWKRKEEEERKEVWEGIERREDGEVRGERRCEKG